MSGSVNAQLRDITYVHVGTCQNDRLIHLRGGEVFFPTIFFFFSSLNYVC